MIKSISFKIKITPKPRGNLAKNGHIYHSSTKYKDFNKHFKYAVRNLKIIDFTHICFFIYIKKRRGHPLDGDNCQGAIQDALVKSNIIPDDNYRIIGKWYGDVIESDEDRIKIFFCQSKKEFIYVINKYGHSE